MMTPSREKRVHQSVSRFPTSANGFIKPSSRARRRAASKAKACLKDIESARLARRWKQVSGDPRLEPSQKLRTPPLLSDPSLVRPCPGGPENFSTRAFLHICPKKLRYTHLCSLSTGVHTARTPGLIDQPRHGAASQCCGDTAKRARTHRPRTGRRVRVR